MRKCSGHARGMHRRVDVARTACVAPMPSIASRRGGTTMHEPDRPHAIIGSGVVGAATGVGLAARGHRVVFCDVDPERVALLVGRGHDAVRASELPSLDAAAYL